MVPVYFDAILAMRESRRVFAIDYMSANNSIAHCPSKDGIVDGVLRKAILMFDPPLG